MVNIQSVVYISNSGQYSFNSFPEYWAYANSIAPASHRRKLEKYKELGDIFSDTVAQQYGYTTEQTRNVHFLFGKIAIATKRLEDVSIRELVFQLENRIILEIKDTVDCVHIVVTVHRKDDFEIITTLGEPKVVAKGQNEQ